MDAPAATSSCLDAARFFPARKGYLNTASCGLPCPDTLDALGRHLGEWRDGLGGPVRWDGPVQECRRMFAELVGVPPGWVSVGPQVSVYAGVVAASLAPGATVLVAEEDFTSVLFPFLAQRERGVRVRVVPLDELVDAVDADTTWVAVSLVQSADGRLLDLARLRRTADQHGTRLFIDATQGAGWLPTEAASCDVLVASGYKFLLNPRGTCYASIRPDALPLLRPHVAGWYAGEVVHESYYGTPLRLAADARRLDVSPAWPCWAGAAPAMRLLLGIGVDALYEHAVGLADGLRSALGLPAAGSAIVSVPGDAEAGERLEAAGITVARRAGRVRLSFHLYNDEDDVRRAADCLTGRASARPA